MIGWMLLGFALGILFAKGCDIVKERAEKKIEKVEEEIKIEGQIKELQKLKEELEKEK